MTAPTSRRPRILPFVLAGFVVVVLAVPVARALVSAVGAATDSSPSNTVDVAAVLTLRGDTVHVREELRGKGIRRVDVQPDLADTDVGYSLNTRERPTGRALAYSHLTSSVASDGHSATVEYDVEGTIVYVMPLSRGVSAGSVDVRVDGGRITSCLTQYGTANGTPRMRPCAPGSGSSFMLRRAGNGLERVRLTLG